jgi:hypothetical protein
MIFNFDLFIGVSKIVLGSQFLYSSLDLNTRPDIWTFYKHF